MSEEANLTIGQVAERAGIATSAIRYYERAGVLPAPERVSGQRRYGEDVVQKLGVIAVAKEAGFTLDEAKVLLDSAEAGRPAHRGLRALADKKLPEVEAMIERAEAVRSWLQVAQECSCDTLDDCALFVGFEDPIGADAVELRVTPKPG